MVKDLLHTRSLIDRTTVAFGQGVSVTPLQMTVALAAMGNGGVLMEPHLIKEIVSPQGKIVKEFPPNPVRRVLSQHTASQMLEIMATVTQTGGTAKEAAPPGFTVAGKTGTAQKIIGRAYSHSKFNALFIGLIPAENPVLAIAVIVDEPKGAIFGGVVAAPIFREIAAQSLRVLAIIPRNPRRTKTNRCWRASGLSGRCGHRAGSGIYPSKTGDSPGASDRHAGPQGVHHPPGAYAVKSFGIALPLRRQRHGRQSRTGARDGHQSRRHLRSEIQVRRLRRPGLVLAII